MIKRSQDYLGRVLGSKRGLKGGGITSLRYQEGGEVMNTAGDINYTDLGGASPHFIYTGQGIMSNYRPTPYNPNNPFADTNPGLADLNLDGVIDQTDLDIWNNTSFGTGQGGAGTGDVVGQSDYEEDIVISPDAPVVDLPQGQQAMPGLMWNAPREAQAGFNPYFETNPYLTDLNNDGQVNAQDFNMYSAGLDDMRSANDALAGQAGYNPYFDTHPYLTDLNNNGVINSQDFMMFSQMYPEMVAANQALGPQGWTSQEWDLAQDSNIPEGGFFVGDPSNPQVYNPYFEDHPWLTDLNNSGEINAQDFAIYSQMYPAMQSYNESLGDAGNPYFDQFPGLTDMNADGVINFKDFNEFSSGWSDMVSANAALNPNQNVATASQQPAQNQGVSPQTTIANAGSGAGFQPPPQMGWGTGQQTANKWYGGFGDSVMSNAGGLTQAFRNAVQNPYAQFQQTAQQQPVQQVGANQQAAGGFGSAQGGLGSLPAQTATGTGPFNFSASPNTFGNTAIS